MNFELTEEQTEVQALARKILEDFCSNEQLRKFDAGERFDDALWSAFATAGLLGVAVEEEYGGMGFDFETLCLVMEELGRSLAPLPLHPALVLAGLGVQRFAGASIKKKVLPGLASGEMFITAEVGLGDLRAERVKDGWQLSGEKPFVPFAARAAHILLTARTEQGPALFLVDKEVAGMSLMEQVSTAGESLSCLKFENAVLSDEQCLLDGPAAATAITELENIGIAANGAQMLGVCDAMMRLTAAYTSEREQFGVKIATFQAVGQRAADCYIDVECLRLVTQQAVFQVNSGKDATEACLVAKIWAGDAGHRVSHAAQHMHGGMGVDRDYSLWRYCLWAKQLELQLGNSAQLTERLGKLIASEFKAA